MRKILVTCIICSLVFTLGLSSIAYAKGDGVNPVETLLQLFSKIENTPQIETGGGLLTDGISDTVTIPFNEEGDQVQHVSLTVAGHHLGVNTKVVVNIDYDYGATLDDHIVIFGDGENMPDNKTIEFNAKHWSLAVYYAEIDPQGPDTTVFYEYTITYPPID